MYVCRLRGWLVLPLVLGWVAGCDATRSPGGSPPPEETTEPGDTNEEPPADGTDESLSLSTPNTRILQVGDTWTYDERQTTSFGGEVSAVSGRHIHEVLPDATTDRTGNPIGVLSATLQGTFNEEDDVIRSVWWYFSQGDDGTFYQHGRINGYVNPPAERYVTWPLQGKYAVVNSPVAVGDTHVWDVAFDDGSRSTGESSVVRIEQVVVPAGTFTAAKVEVSETETDDGVTYAWESTLWYVPELGREVKGFFNLVIDDEGGVLHATSSRVRELTEINLMEVEESDDTGLEGDGSSDEEDVSSGEGDEAADAADEAEEEDGDTGPGDTSEEEGDGSVADDEADGSDADGETGEAGVPPLPEGAEFVTTATGLQYYDFELGAGQQPVETSTVTVDYVGYLEDGTVFDSAEGAQFDLAMVVDGFAEGVSGMAEGGQRRLLVPPELGYGPEGNPAAGISGDANLIFDVALISVDEL